MSALVDMGRWQAWRERQAEKPAGPKLTPYTGLLNELKPEDYRFFETRYGIITPNMRIFRGDDDRYALPIFSPVDALARGHVLRAPWPGSPLSGARDWSGTRKALTYTSAYGPIQSFYKGHGPQFASRPLVIVEDQLSAIKLAEIGLNAMAILGTPNKGEIGMDRLSELTRIYSTETIVALDADATEQAFEFARKWGSAFKKLRVAILAQDIKDTPKDDIFGVLGL
jgi:hypothetical protein